MWIVSKYFPQILIKITKERSFYGGEGWQAPFNQLVELDISNKKTFPYLSFLV